MISNKPLPPGWSEAVLSDVAEINPAHPTSRPSDDTPVTFVPMAAVDPLSGRLDASNLRPWQEVMRGYTRFQEGDVLFAKITPCMENGKAAIARGLATGLGAGSTEFHVLRPTSALRAEILLHYVLQEEFRKAARARMTGTAGQLRVPSRFLEEQTIPVPPVAEQHRIVEAIESYFTRLDDAVATLERVHRNLRRYRASVLQAAVEGRLVPTEAELARADGRTYEPASVLLERILAERRRRWEDAELAKMKVRGKVPKDDRWKERYEEPVAPDTSHLPELPEGWSWASVDQLERGDRRSAYGVLVPGPDLPNGVPLLRVGDINSGRIDGTKLKRIDRRVADKFARTYLQGGEVLITLVGTIGRSAVVPPALAGSNVARAVGVIPASGLVCPHWIEYWFRSPRTRQRMASKAHEVARKTLNLEDVRAAAVPLSPRREQERVRDAVEDFESIADSLLEARDASVLRCYRLRQSILRWAFEGRLVDQDPTDEPAALLLERIRVERHGSQAQATPIAPPRKVRSPHA